MRSETNPVFTLRRAETKRSAKLFLRELRKEQSDNYLNPNVDATVVKEARNQYYVSHWVTCFLAVFGLGVCTLEHEIYMKYGFENKNDLRFRLLCINWVVNLLICISLFFSYKLYIRLLKMEHLLYKSDGLYYTDLWKPLIVEMLLNLFSPFPYLYDIKYPDLYRGRPSDLRVYVNTPILCISFAIRTYHIVMVLLENSDYMNSRAFRVCKSVGCRSNYMFAIR